jgi:hypothetical protein
MSMTAVSRQVLALDRLSRTAGWCGSSERRVNYEILTGRRGDF